MRRAAAAVLIAFCLAAGTPAAAHPLSFPDEATVGAREEAAAPTSLVVPVEVLHILERAAAASPRALELDREEALADSRHRAQMAALTTSTGWRATVQARQEGDSAKDGVAGAFQWVVRYPIGRSELAWSIGPGVANRWRDGKTDTAPVVSLTARHPFGQGPDVRRDRIDHERAEAALRHQREWNRFVEDVLDAYGKAAVADAALEAAQWRLRLAEAVWQETKARADQGEASSLALYEARQGWMDAQSAWEDAVLARDEARRALSLLLGGVHGWEEQGDLEGHAGADSPEALAALRLDGVYPEAMGREDWLSLARSQRLEEALADEAVRLAEAELESARRRRGWSGEWTVGATYPDPDSFPGTAKRRPNFRVGAQFQLPLNDPAGAEAVVQAELQLEEARAEQAQAARLVENEVESAFQRAERALARLARAQREQERAAWALEVAEANVAAGLATERAMLEAKVMWAMAEQRVVAARYEVIRYVTALWHAAGGQATW